MIIFEQIKHLADKRVKNLKTVSTELGFRENAIYKWKVQSPTIKNLSKIVDYFRVR